MDYVLLEAGPIHMKLPIRSHVQETMSRPENVGGLDRLLD